MPVILLVLEAVDFNGARNIFIEGAGGFMNFALTDDAYLWIKVRIYFLKHLIGHQYHQKTIQL